METRLEQIVEALGNNSSSSGSAGNGTAVPSETLENNPPTSQPVVARMGSRREKSFAVHSQQNRRGLGDNGERDSVVGAGGGQPLLEKDECDDDQDPPREDGSGPDLDDFIDMYHAEVTGS